MIKSYTRAYVGMKLNNRPVPTSRVITSPLCLARYNPKVYNGQTSLAGKALFVNAVSIDGRSVWVEFVHKPKAKECGPSLVELFAGQFMLSLDSVREF